MQKFVEKRSSPQPMKKSTSSLQKIPNLQNLQQKSMKPKLKKIFVEKTNIRKYLSKPKSDPPPSPCSKIPAKLKIQKPEEDESKFASLKSREERKDDNISRIDTVRSGGEEICNTFHSKINFFKKLQSSASSQGNLKILEPRPPNKFATESESKENKLTSKVIKQGRENRTNGKPAAGRMNQSEEGRVDQERSGKEEL